MITLNQEPPARFVVCESTTRWQSALFRFAPQLVPTQRSVEVKAAEPIQVRSLVRSVHPIVVFWEIGSERMSETVHEMVFTQIATLKAVSPRVAQFAVGEGARPPHDSLVLLAELGVDGFMEHPEYLGRWRQFFLGHFARAAGDLD